MPAAAVAGIGALGSVVGGIMGGDAANDAAKAQAKAAKQALALQREMYNTTRGDLSPYRDTGQQALYSLADLYGFKTPNQPGGSEAFNENALERFKMSPDYQVAYKEGIDALDKTAAAKGRLLSGGQIKRVMEYGADLGSKGFGSYMNRLYQLAGLGQNAAAQSGNAAANFASGGANSLMARGEAQAGGIVGGFNALSNGLEGAFNNLSFAAMNKYGTGTNSGMPDFSRLY